MHLQELAVVIDRITGENQNSNILGKEINKTPNGIIEEMSCTLNDLELNVDRLLTLKNVLCAHTFSPLEILQ